MKVMVVDDEADVRLLFEQRFRKEIRSGSIAFYFVQSAQEALTFLESQEKDLLVLSDINMPGMSGFELLTQIKRMRPDVPVIMISAYGEDKQAMALELGADGFVSKPIDFQTLRPLILQER